MSNSWYKCYYTNNGVLITVEGTVCLSLYLYPAKKIASAANDRKMTLKGMRSKIPHMWSTGTPEAQISSRFTLRLAISKTFVSLALFDYVGRAHEIKIHPLSICLSLSQLIISVPLLATPSLPPLSQLMSSVEAATCS